MASKISIHWALLDLELHEFDPVPTQQKVVNLHIYGSVVRHIS